MKTIFLVRHLEPLKKEKINYINHDSEQMQNELFPLSINGENKAALLTSKLFATNINNLWSSQYVRAISTAKYIAETNNLMINVSSDFNERKIGHSENIGEDFWLTQLYDENVKTPDGESRKEVKDRMLKGIHRVLNETNDGEISVIVTHAAALTFLLMNWCELVNAELKRKKRWLKFKDKVVNNDSFNTPEVFQLIFENNELMDMSRIEICFKF